MERVKIYFENEQKIHKICLECYFRGICIVIFTLDEWPRNWGNRHTDLQMVLYVMVCFMGSRLSVTVQRTNQSFRSYYYVHSTRVLFDALYTGSKSLVVVV